ncbi:MAG: amidohydrolase [Hydrogenibacillus schlegelii]|uniref:5-methylthioadenosine/S-adenosylhomocysteine deaminase n=1 Tax=Hydrogenibacillus schlegelii TaxID=1484 RepID=A0A947CZI5_HYDSH|nr:amidohydrolase [Hydrogenibacillus schlegelii]
MRLVLEDALLYQDGRLVRGHLVIEGGRIAAVEREGDPPAPGVGPRSAPSGGPDGGNRSAPGDGAMNAADDVGGPAHPPAERRSLAGRIVLPGLVNAHTHTPMSLLRGLGEGLPLKRWLEEAMWPNEAAFTDEDVYWGTLLAQLEMIESGTTAFAEMYDRIDVIAQAVGESGLRAVLARGMIGLGDEATRRAKLAEAIDVARRWHGAYGGRVTTMIAPHSAYTCPEPFLREVAEAARDLGRPIHTHLAETEAEEAEVRARTGRSSARVMLEAGLFDGPALVAHAVYLSDDELRLLAERDVRIAHNPVSNLKLGSGIAPLARWLELGLVVGLGTDGPASNNNLDLFDEMRLASLLAKGREKDAAAVPPAAALELATAGGAKALFLEDVGRLAPGMRADLIVIDPSSVRYVPAHDLLSHLVYNGRGTDVESVMVDGRWLMWRRTVLTLDAERIRYEAERRSRRFRAGGAAGGPAKGPAGGAA